MTAHWTKNNKSVARFRQFHIDIHTYHDREQVEITVSADGQFDEDLDCEVLEPDVEFALKQFIDTLAGDYESIVVWNKAIMLDCALGNQNIDDDDYDDDDITGDFRRIN